MADSQFHSIRKSGVVYEQKTTNESVFFFREILHEVVEQKESVQ